MDLATQNTLAAHFRSLHVPGDPILLCNVYDGATANIIVSNPHARAVATASYAIAATYGIDDDDMTLQQNLVGIAKVAHVVTKTKLPLTVDLQDGYEDVGFSVREVIKLGAVGCNLEDVDCKAGKLREVEEAVERVKSAVKAAEEAGVPAFVVNARTDVLGYGGSVEDAIERGRKYLAAGANTVFVWGGAGGRGVRTEEVKRLIEGLEGRVNVKMNVREGFLTVRELRELGVARISVGPELFHKAMKVYRKAAFGLLGD
jgi:2-methylisocitrate lyase-like PEP mutase family enzyme